MNTETDSAADSGTENSRRRDHVSDNFLVLDDKPEEVRKDSYIRYDLFILLSISIAISLVAIHFDVLELLVEWSEEYEEYEIDEIFTLLIVMSFAFAFFSWRRVRELNQQIIIRNQAEQSVRHLAMHDPLTGLPNRALFFQRLELELDRTRRDHKRVSVFALDLDNFKQINDVYGHGTGDALLIAAAERLEILLRKTDIVARLGGDEFAIIQPSLDEPTHAAALAMRVVQEMAAPFEIKGHEFVTSISVGITLSSVDMDDPVELLRAADVALYRSKAEGRSTYRFFDPDMDAQLHKRQQLERDLWEALASEQFALHYQPLFTIPAQELKGFEALIRWNHPTRGFVSPLDFIPLAEETGLIHRIGEWVFFEACRTAATWPQPLTVAVNVSPVQFKKGDLVGNVKSVLSKSGLAPGRLELEITESVLIQDTDDVIKILGELKTLGVRISMDDFGTGYSSLSYLRKFPFDKIKIDRSFVNDLEKNKDDAAIVRAVVAMSQSLGMITLAEGIESSGQLESLCAEGCEEAQGFLLGRPMPGLETLILISNTDGSSAEAANRSDGAPVTPNNP